MTIWSWSMTPETVARSLPVLSTFTREISPFGLCARQSVKVPPVSTQMYQNPDTLSIKFLLWYRFRESNCEYSNDRLPFRCQRIIYNLQPSGSIDKSNCPRFVFFIHTCSLDLVQSFPLTDRLPDRIDVLHEHG